MRRINRFEYVKPLLPPLSEKLPDDTIFEFHRQLDKTADIFAYIEAMEFVVDCKPNELVQRYSSKINSVLLERFLNYNKKRTTCVEFPMGWAIDDFIKKFGKEKYFLFLRICKLMKIECNNLMFLALKDDYIICAIHGRILKKTTRSSTDTINIFSIDETYVRIGMSDEKQDTDVYSTVDGSSVLFVKDLLMNFFPKYHILYDRKNHDTCYMFSNLLIDTIVLPSIAYVTAETYILPEVDKIRNIASAGANFRYDNEVITRCTTEIRCDLVSLIREFYFDLDIIRKPENKLIWRVFQQFAHISEEQLKFYDSIPDNRGYQIFVLNKGYCNKIINRKVNMGRLLKRAGLDEKQNENCTIMMQQACGRMISAKNSGGFCTMHASKYHIMVTDVIAEYITRFAGFEEINDSDEELKASELINRKQLTNEFLDSEFLLHHYHKYLNHVYRKKISRMFIIFTEEQRILHNLVTCGLITDEKKTTDDQTNKYTHWTSFLRKNVYDPRLLLYIIMFCDGIFRF